MRERCIDILWARAAETLYLTREQFVASLDGWEIAPVMVKGALAFVTLKKGAEFHFASARACHGISLGVVREVLRAQLDTHGHILTRTPKHETRQRRFNEIVGFVQTGEDEFDIHYRLDRMPGRAPQQEQPSCP